MADMKFFDGWDDVVRCVAVARDRGRMTSNFFLDEKRMARWCEKRAFSCAEFGKTTFLIRHQQDFLNLYFLTESSEDIAEDVQQLISASVPFRWVVDVLGRDAMREPLEAAFRSAGFTALTTLQRMSRRTPDEAFVHESGIAVAHQADAGAIRTLLLGHFNAEEEQLPELEEIQDWINAGEIFVARGNSEHDIRGFVIFDLSPAALYLRYWFVSPRDRGNGLGGRLMRSMFAAGADTKRQYFWVKTDNENAIVRYRHYGFEFEPLKDIVLAHLEVPQFFGHENRHAPSDKG